jgi:hypothetical protein
VVTGAHWRSSSLGAASSYESGGRGVDRGVSSYTPHDGARVRRARTQEPLLSVPLEQLHTSRQGGFDVAIPIDAQWKRIEARRGPAAFLIVAASNKYEAGRQTYALSSVGLALRVKRNGSDASLTPTRETPFGYSSYTPNNGFKFAADPGDRIHVGPEMVGLWCRSRKRSGPPASAWWSIALAYRG